MPDPLLAALNEDACKAGLGEIISDIYGAAKSFVKGKIKQHQLEAKIRHAYEHISVARRIKSILKSDGAIDLLSIYYPTRISEMSDQSATRMNRTSRKKDRKVISSVSDFPENSRVLVTGTVGQGKSVFMRYLTIAEIAKGNRMPLFIELRRIDENNTLSDCIHNELNMLDLGPPDELLTHLGKSGKLVFLFDGFDEVSPDRVKRTAREIEKICKLYDACPVIVSSRPDSQLHKSSLFDFARVSPLEGREYEEVIRRCVDDPARAEALIRRLRSPESKEIGQLLVTPLMVALLIVKYLVENSIPENRIDFYRDLFRVLLARHDDSKIDFERSRKSSLSDVQMRALFNALCYLAARDDRLIFSDDQLISLIEKARQLEGIDASAEKIRDDIVSITCLILREGDEHQFIHKSIVEYHSAEFISQQPDEGAVIFYSLMSKKWNPRWHPQIDFLLHMDRYRYCRYCAMPRIYKVLDIPEGKHLSKVKATKTMILKYFYPITILRADWIKGDLLNSIRSTGEAEELPYLSGSDETRLLRGATTSGLFGEKPKISPADLEACGGIRINVEDDDDDDFKVTAGVDIVVRVECSCRMVRVLKKRKLSDAIFDLPKDLLSQYLQRAVLAQKDIERIEHNQSQKGLFDV